MKKALSPSYLVRKAQTEWIKDDDTCINRSVKEQQLPSTAVDGEANNQNPRNPRQAADHDTILDKNRPLVSLVPGMEHLLLILREHKLNWFAFVVKLRTLLQNYSEETLVDALTDVSDNLENMDLTDEEKVKVEMSKQAYLNMRLKAMVSDCDSDDPDSFLAENSNKQVKLQRQKIKRKAKSFLARTKAEQRLLKRRVPKAVSKVLNKFPNITKDVEVFVRSRAVGADASSLLMAT